MNGSTKEMVTSLNDSTKETVTSLNDSTKETVTSLNGSTKETVTSLNGSTKETLTSLNSSTKETVTSLNGSTKETLTSLNSSTKETVTSQYGSVKESVKKHHDHGGAVGVIQNNMPDIDTLYDLAELFKVFGDSTRIRILFALFESEICVCGLAEALDMTVSAISHQLRVLKQANLVRCRRDGRTVFYSLADEHVKTILAQGIDHIKE